MSDLTSLNLTPIQKTILAGLGSYAVSKDPIITAGVLGVGYATNILEMRTGLEDMMALFNTGTVSSGGDDSGNYGEGDSDDSSGEDDYDPPADDDNSDPTDDPTSLTLMEWYKANPQSGSYATTGRVKIKISSGNSRSMSFEGVDSEGVWSALNVEETAKALAYYQNWYAEASSVISLAELNSIISSNYGLNFRDFINSIMNGNQPFYGSTIQIPLEQWFDLGLLSSGTIPLAVNSVSEVSDTGITWLAEVHREDRSLTRTWTDADGTHYMYDVTSVWDLQFQLGNQITGNVTKLGAATKYEVYSRIWNQEVMQLERESDSDGIALLPSFQIPDLNEELLNFATDPVYREQCKGVVMQWRRSRYFTDYVLVPGDDGPIP